MSNEAQTVEAEIVEEPVGTTAVVRRSSDVAVMSWQGAAERAVAARRERERIIAEVLVEGVDVATIPGCGPKPALMKSGGEKIIDAFNCWPDFQPVQVIEDWDRPLFFYRYRCTIRTRGENIAVSSGIGSCNSMEAKYRWRDAQAVCPKCKQPTIIAGKEEYGGGWLCWKKRGGCGAKYADNAPEIMDQPRGRVENDDLFTQVNTIDKMAQKRAMIAATLLMGFSQDFTQDIEDNPSSFSGGQVATEPQAPPADRLGFSWPQIGQAFGDLGQAERVMPDEIRAWAKLDPNLPEIPGDWNQLHIAYAVSRIQKLGWQHIIGRLQNAAKNGVEGLKAKLAKSEPEPTITPELWAEYDHVIEACMLTLEEITAFEAPHGPRQGWTRERYDTALRALTESGGDAAIKALARTLWAPLTEDERAACLKAIEKGTHMKDQTARRTAWDKVIARLRERQQERPEQPEPPTDLGLEV